MLRAAIVGDHASGKTTFLGLLYATLVRSGSGKEDELRFRVKYESLEEISALFQRLMSGGFPDAATKEGIRGLSFEANFPPPTRLSFRGLRSRGRSGGAATTVQVTIPGSLDDEKRGPFSGSVLGGGTWSDVFDADALVLLVDSTKLGPNAKGSEPGPLAGYDRRVESLFTSIRRWRAQGGRAVLHPVFAFSKFDAVDPKLLQAAGLDPAPPPVKERARRSTYAHALLEKNVPRTLASLRKEDDKRFRFAEPAFCFSWVRTENEGPDPREKIRLRRGESGGWELDYFVGEYLGLLDRLGEIAGMTKD